MGVANNSAKLLGEVVSDAVSYANGTIVGLSVRTEKRFTPKGETEVSVREEFHTVYVYGDKVGIAGTLTKGAAVYLEGFVRTRELNDTGMPFKVYSTEVIIDDRQGSVIPVGSAAQHINEVRLVGNLGQDGEFKNQNTAMLKLSLATPRYDFNAASDVTDWHRVSIFGKRAASLSNACNKGKSMIIVGELQTRRWKDQGSGYDRHSTDVVVSAFDGDIKFVGGGRSGGTPSGGVERQMHAPA